MDLNLIVELKFGLICPIYYIPWLVNSCQIRNMKICKSSINGDMRPDHEIYILELEYMHILHMWLIGLDN